jgi:hypothetical protein
LNVMLQSGCFYFPKNFSGYPLPHANSRWFAMSFRMHAP